MIKKLTKHGNSYAMVIDRPILKLLYIHPDTPLEPGTNGESLLVRPVRDEEREGKLLQSLEQINRMYGEDLQRFAE